MLEKTADHAKHGISLTHKRNETKDSAAKDPTVLLAEKLTCKYGGRKFYTWEVWVTLGNETVCRKTGNHFPRIVSCLFNSYTEKADSYKRKRKRAPMEQQNIRESSSWMLGSNDKSP